MTRDEHLRRVSDKEPIHDHGLGKPQDGGRHGSLSRREIDICRCWIQEFAKAGDRFNLRVGSYGLKHVVERWAWEYVSNGAFIQAAREEGFDLGRYGNSPNAVFNMFRKDTGRGVTISPHFEPLRPGERLKAPRFPPGPIFDRGPVEDMTRDFIASRPGLLEETRALQQRASR